MPVTYDPTDPYQPIFSPTLAAQKKAGLQQKLIDKEQKIAPAPVIPAIDDPAVAASLASAQFDFDPAASNSNLIDIAQSAIYQGNRRLYDLATGRTDRLESDLQAEGDLARGVTQEARDRFITDPNARVDASLAEGDHIGALVGSVFDAGPGNLANSANVLTEIAATALAARASPVLGRTVGGALFGGKKVAKGAETTIDAIDRVKAAKKIEKSKTTADRIAQAAKTVVRTARDASVAAAGITQSQISQSREKHGIDPTRGEKIAFYFSNLATMSGQVGVIKHFIVPKFKKEFFKEVKNVAANITRGSSLLHAAQRVGQGAGKILAAGTAEFGQEYVQTWVEIINVEIGPREGKNFLEEVAKQLNDSGNQDQAKLAAFLGFGAGAVAKGTVAAPSIAAGTTLDLTKASAKGVVNTAVGASKLVGRGAQTLANNASLKVLNAEERQQLVDQNERDKIIVKQKTADIDRKIDLVTSANTIAELQGTKDLSRIVDQLQRARKESSLDLDSPAALKAFKDEVISNFKAQKAKIIAVQEGSNIARIVKKAGKNAVDKSVAKAQALLKEVPLDELLQAVETAKEFGEASVEAVKQIRSSTARGVLDLALREGSKASKTILKAASNLEVNDLERIAAVVSEKDQPLAKQIRTLIAAKKKGQRQFNQRNSNLITAETVDKSLIALNRSKVLSNDQASAIGTVINETVNGKISDLASLEVVEKAIKILEKSESFQKQTDGSLKPVDLAAIKSKLKQASKKIRKPITTAAKAKLKAAKKEIKKVGLLEYFSDAAVVTKTAELLESETVTDFVAKIKKTLPNLPDLETEEGIEAFEKQISKTFDKVAETAQTAKEIVTGPAPEQKTIEQGSKLHQLVKIAEKALTKKKSAKQIFDNFPFFVEELKKAGYETRDDIAALFAEFPKLADNQKFVANLLVVFPADDVTTEQTDKLATEERSDAAKLEQFEKDNYGCPA